MTPQGKRISLIVVAALALFVIGVGWCCYRRPVGYFDSTSILGYHDGGDVLSFRDGVVLYSTCHGESRMGTYSRTNGMWIWHVQGRDWRIQPGLFSLSCQDLANPTNLFTGRRRFSKPALDEHGLSD